jgi:RNA polymerase sigma-70 factor (ECF subfamily)
VNEDTIMGKEIDQYVRMLKDGDNDAFDYIYYETKNSVFLIIVSILKDYSLAEDVMQDTYMNMIKALDRYQEGTNFKNWIITMARNLAINEYNRRKKETLVDITNENNVFGGIEDTRKYEGWLIDDVMLYLDENERQVILLRFSENMLHKDIAQALDMPLGTVLWIYQKAIKKIKKMIKKGGD